MPLKRGMHDKGLIERLAARDALSEEEKQVWLNEIKRVTARAVREAEAEMRRNAELFRNNRYIG